jgi:NAD(P)H dehydrogenase (quinone)
LKLQKLLAKWAAALRARCWTRERAGFARLLNRSVRASIVPRKTWEALFRSQGMKNPTPRIRMLDGFNEGWLAFEHDTRKGRVELDTVLRTLIDRAP